jgi:hypothetical protein
VLVKVPLKDARRSAAARSAGALVLVGLVLSADGHGRHFNVQLEVSRSQVPTVQSVLVPVVTGSR